MKAPIESRSKAIGSLIRKLVAERKANTRYLSEYMPNYRRRIQYYESGDRQINLDAFINLMTALRCEVVVVPLGRCGESGWYRLNDFPSNSGEVLKMPDKVEKGHDRRKRGTEYLRNAHDCNPEERK